MDDIPVERLAAAPMIGGQQPLVALGMMSGTSLDGIDAALLTTDGTRVQGFGPASTTPYEAAFRADVRALLGRRPSGDDQPTIDRLTHLHAEAALRLIAESQLPREAVAVIGFHGQTVWHRPEDGETIQVGDGQLLADLTGIPVVSDFRTDDVAAGGQGAPLVPLYHVARAADEDPPLAVLNLGGVGNLTWIGTRGADLPPPVLAFDTGPGNALLDDWVRRKNGWAMDEGGRLAANGRVDGDRVAALLRNPYFSLPPPKSLDRDRFRQALDAVDDLSPADGAATLAAFTAGAVASALPFLPQPPRRWLVCGGGRHNAAMMAMLGDRLAVPVEPVEAVGWRGDSLEAEAFAFLAVRSLYRLPLTLPETTGVAQPCTGGRLHVPRNGAITAGPGFQPWPTPYPGNGR